MDYVHCSIAGDGTVGGVGACVAGGGVNDESCGDKTQPTIPSVKTSAKLATIVSVFIIVYCYSQQLCTIVILPDNTNVNTY